MNRTLTIVIEDKKKATEAGLIQKIGTYLKKKLAPNKYIVDQLRNGDAIIVDLGKKSYQVEQQFVEFITPTSYRRTPRSQNVALEDTLFLMRDNQRIFSMLEDLLDIANDERTVIRVQVEPKKPTIQKVNIRTVDGFISMETMYVLAGTLMPLNTIG
jgi:hypothetical protein